MVERRRHNTESASPVSNVPYTIGIARGKDKQNTSAISAVQNILSVETAFDHIGLPPHPTPLPEGEGVCRATRGMLFLPLPLGEGWGEGEQNHPFSQPTVRCPPGEGWGEGEQNRTPWYPRQRCLRNPTERFAYRISPPHYLDSTGFSKGLGMVFHLLDNLFRTALICHSAISRTKTAPTPTL